MIDSRLSGQRIGRVSARGRWLRVCVVGLGVACACAAPFIALRDGPARQAQAARHGLASLPLTARGPISAALGRDETAYRLTGLRTLNPAQHLRADFSDRGVAVVSGRARLAISLAAYGYASAQRPLGAVVPRVSANRVTYVHRSLQEWFANGPLGLEQGFDVPARPDAGTGSLSFSLALSGNLVPRLRGGSLLLQGRGVELRYGDLLATDARGRVLHSWLQLVRGHLVIRVDDRGAAYPLRIDPFIQQAELTASDGAANDYLGYSVAVSGATIVVGAFDHKVGSHVGQGAAYVYVMPPSGWASATQSAELTASDGAEGDGLGRSVALSGNTVLVGAFDHEVASHVHQGAAYVYVMPPSGWAGSLTQTAELTSSDGAENDEFGSSIAASEATAVVGAPGHKVGSNTSQGAAYVYVMPPSGWAGSLTQTAELTTAGGAKNDRTGQSVAVSGPTVVAGAPEHQVSSNASQGAAYVFVMPPLGWAGSLTQAAELTASDGGAEDFLGYRVAIAGDTIVASAPFHKVGATAEQGAAYVFAMPSSGWSGSLTQTAELTASDGETDDALGYSVALSGNTVLVGAPFHKVGATAEQGATYVFAMPPSGWSGSLTQTAELTASDGETGERFGWSAAAAGSTLIAGAPNHKADTNAEQGAAYAFVAPPSIAISSPSNGTTYIQGQAIAANYACSAPEGASVTACTGSVANGTAIDTSTLGAHTFIVTTTDSDGLADSQSVGYTVAAPAAPVAPILSGLSETTRTWREGTALARISTTDKGTTRKPPVGTTFSFGLNEPASVALMFTEPARGRKAGKVCVAQTKRNKNKRRCTRTVIAGTLTVSAHAGSSKVRFQGIISKHKKLKPGSYTLLAVATAEGKHSNTRTLRLTILPAGPAPEHFACSGANSAKQPCYFSTPSGNVRCAWTPATNTVTCEMLATKRAYELGATGHAKTVKVTLTRRGETLPTNQLLSFPENLGCDATSTTMFCGQAYGLGEFKLSPQGSHAA